MSSITTIMCEPLPDKYVQYKCPSLTTQAEFLWCVPVNINIAAKTTTRCSGTDIDDSFLVLV